MLVFRSFSSPLPPGSGLFFYSLDTLRKSLDLNYTH
ncbi:hypothetical protein EVA_21087 [gut metagenome]|uniref:Uncharacterized protein n=1 Tax=gut metagenome TaxID=749906 RepID=J9FMG0_9ZZZZ